MLTHPSRERFTVYEAANNELKEIFVTLTNSSIFDSMGALGKHLPSAIAHWKPERQHIHFRSLAFDLKAEDAQDFIARHVAKRVPGWKYLVEETEKL